MNAQAPSVALRHVLEYAGLGWPVFPCDPATKAPLVAGGFRRATRDAGVTREWWTSHPEAMIGVPTGPASGFWVLDVDLDEKGGKDWSLRLAELESEHGRLPDTVSTRTPRGGLHLLFRWSPDHPVRNSAGQLGPGIDVRGDGGYVIMPPSVRAHGVAYAFEKPPGVFDIDEAPRWLLQVACNPSRRATLLAGQTARTRSSVRPSDVPTKPYVSAAVDREIELVRSAAKGTRNHQLNKSAFNLGQLAGTGLLHPGHVEHLLFEAAGAAGLVAEDGHYSVRGTIGSGLAAGARRPRTSQLPCRIVKENAHERLAGGDGLRGDRARPRGYHAGRGRSCVCEAGRRKASVLSRYGRLVSMDRHALEEGPHRLGLPVRSPRGPRSKRGRGTEGP
jgi:hypothetical protein